MLSHIKESTNPKRKHNHTRQKIMCMWNTVEHHSLEYWWLYINKMWLSYQFYLSNNRPSHWSPKQILSFINSTSSQAGVYIFTNKFFSQVLYNKLACSTSFCLFLQSFQFNGTLRKVVYELIRERENNK